MKPPRRWASDAGSNRATSTEREHSISGYGILSGNPGSTAGPGSGDGTPLRRPVCVAWRAGAAKRPNTPSSAWRLPARSGSVIALRPRRTLGDRAAGECSAFLLNFPNRLQSGDRTIDAPPLFFQFADQLGDVHPFASDAGAGGERSADRTSEFEIPPSSNLICSPRTALFAQNQGWILGHYLTRNGQTFTSRYP